MYYVDNQMSVQYVDKDELIINVTSVVIKVRSINQILGSVVEFMQLYGLTGHTNGKLLVLPANSEDELIAIHNDVLLPEGFKVFADYYTQWLPTIGDGWDFEKLHKQLFLQLDAYKEISWIKYHSLGEKGFGINLLSS